MTEDTLSANIPANNKFFGIFGLGLGIASGYLGFHGEGNLWGLGIMLGMLFGGITTGYFIYFILKKEKFSDNQSMFLGGTVTGFFIAVFVFNLILFPSIFVK